MADLIKDFPNYSITKCGIVTNLKTNHVLSQWVGANGYKHVDLRIDGKPVKVAVHRLLAIQYIPNPDSKRTVNHIDGNKLNNSLSNLEWNTYGENTKHAYDNDLQPYKRNYSLEEYQSILKTRFLKGESLTQISETINQSLSQLSLHLREVATDLDLLDQYETELKTQKATTMKQAGLAKRNIINLQMLDKQTNEILQTFTSIAEAKEFLDKTSSGPISNVLSGRQKSAYGYKWKKT